MNLYLLKFNNYYNRIVKKFDTLAEYLVSPYYEEGNLIENVINFNPGDGVNTTQIVNNPVTCDYAILADGTDIVSRWFVVDSKRERNRQYTLTLHRDLVVDNYNTILDAPCFIEKATVNNNDPAIFNNENMGFNQIKTTETQLKDETNSAWVVGYIPKDSFTEGKEVKASAILEDSADITVDNLTNWDYYQYAINPFKGDYVGPVNFCGFANGTTIAIGVVSSGIFAFGISNLGNQSTSLDDRDRFGLKGITSLDNPGYNVAIPQSTAFQDLADQLTINWLTNSDNFRSLSYAYTNLHSLEEELIFNNLNGKVIYESDSGLYRRIKITKELVSNTYTVIRAGNLFNKMDSTLNKELTGGTISGEANSNTYSVTYSYHSYNISFEQIPVEIKTTIDNNRYHLEDQPYDMFCIPYSNDLEIYKNGTKLFRANKSIAINMATEIGADTGSANVYDVQLLPYCPVRYCIKEDGTFDIGNAKVNYIVNGNEENIGVILWANTSQFTFNILQNIEVTDYKVSNECDLYRLVSPNYNGQFEFSAAKNGGVSYFNVDCSYKPFNPYIHINPNFNRLYGQDFNDARGLICNGDFSLPQTSNAWANYELSNKNYQNIFDRQIQNMEYNNKMSNIQSGIAGATGALSQGIMAGSVFGVGAGIVSGIMSLAGAGADIGLQKAMQNEALDYKKDMFGYELGNIKAMPSSLAKTSAFTYNNKIFPILEYYTCSETEKQALKDKIKYNGMTVMRIGKISEFLQPDYSYIKGQVIRLEQISDDTHYLNEIANEINKGVFIK